MNIQFKIRVFSSKKRRASVEFEKTSVEFKEASGEYRVREDE